MSTAATTAWQDYPCPLEYRYYDVRLIGGNVLEKVHTTNYLRFYRPAMGFIAPWIIEAVRPATPPISARLYG